MKLEIYNDTVPFDTDVKRFRLPAYVIAICPECGVEVERYCGDDHYLSYPWANEPFELTMFHDNGDDEGEYFHHEWPVKVILRITLETAENGEETEETEEG